MEILLTINGVRKLPLEINAEALKLLQDPNAEFEITLVASPSGEETRFPLGEEDPQTVRKVKALFVSNIKIHK